MKKPSRAVLVTLKFVFAGILWILFSDYLINVIEIGHPTYNVAHLQMLKGILFIGACGAFIFTLLCDNDKFLTNGLSGHEMLYRKNPMPLALVGAESFRFLELNEAGVRNLGYQSGQLAFVTLKDIVVPEQRDRFDEVYLFIKTGFDKLGTWDFKTASGEIFSAELSAMAVPSRQAYLIGFRDVTEERRMKSELTNTKKNLQQQIARRTDYLERANEEMAYRASQTEHVNAELIVVNEQLLRINKRIAAEAEELSNYKHNIGQIFNSLREAVWSHNLSDGGKCFIGAGLPQLFEASEADLDSAWFWLNFIHPDDHLQREVHQRTVFEKGETISTFRIVTKRGNERTLFVHVRISRNSAGSTFLVGSFADVSGYPSESASPFINARTA
jgi:PAS domain S-box-containing protein